MKKEKIEDLKKQLEERLEEDSRIHREDNTALMFYLKDSSDINQRIKILTEMLEKKEDEKNNGNKDEIIIMKKEKIENTIKQLEEESERLKRFSEEGDFFSTIDNELIGERIEELEEMLEEKENEEDEEEIYVYDASLEHGKRSLALGEEARYGMNKYVGFTGATEVVRYHDNQGNEIYTNGRIQIPKEYVIEIDAMDYYWHSTYLNIIEDYKKHVIIFNQRKKIKAALDNAKRIPIGEGKTYFDVMMNQRIEGPENAGSSYKVDSPEELYEKLISQDWEETTHPDVMAGCKIFKSNLPGLEGILNIESLPYDVELYAIDPKGTGKIGIGAGKVEKNPANETYLIIGKENIDGKDEDVVFTFHPGEPVRPSEIETKDIADGTKLTKGEAKKLGFDKVKYLSEEMLEQYRNKYNTILLEELESAKNEVEELEKIAALEPELSELSNNDLLHLHNIVDIAPAKSELMFGSARRKVGELEKKLEEHQAMLLESKASKITLQEQRKSEQNKEIAELEEQMQSKEDNKEEKDD